MKHWINKYIIMVCSCLLAWSCSDEVLVQQSEVGKPVDVVLGFGATNNDPIEINTRATYDLHYESMVRNVYAYVFANGEKIYGHYFGADDLNKTTQKEYWTVTNMTSDNTGTTEGTLRMSVPAVSQGAEIVLIANIDLDFMNVSQERLGLVRTKSDLSELVVSLNQEIPDRNAGYFMMTGSKSNVTIAQDGTINTNGRIMLQRLDAKVEVNVRVNPNETTNSQKVKKFTPESWEVINMPKSSHLVPNDTPLQLTEDSYFNLSPKNFETTENEAGNTGGVLYGFSFYTLENKRSDDRKKSVGGNYHNRDRRNKNADGSYKNENGMWEYAPEQATYLIIKGELEMVVDPGLTTEQHLIADVTYYVHLGDFAADKDNYDVVRNTHYKYTINVKGVDNIELEVETSNGNQSDVTENQPGAMGHLYEAEADTYTFDAHYGQRVYTIKASEVDTEQITWYVRTPFGREGIPQKDASGKEIYNDLDYKWVEFMLNEKVSDSYSNANQKYPKDKSKLLTVVDVVNLIKNEVTAWKEGRDSQVDKNGELKFTVFVNEFYYEQNPMNPNDPDILWKKFVNQPNRLMHILCKYNRSADGDSSVTGSILTIRQRSIQTPYNTNPAKTSLTTAWGCETVDEMNNEAWFYPGENVSNAGNKPSYTSDNTSRTDGLYNTACLLNLVQGTGNNKSLNTTLRWDTFIDYSGNDIKLKDEYNGGLYSSLLRNRDLDGEGDIDPDELRWYIASLDQLCGLFIGDQGLSGDAQLYPISASREPNAKINDGNNPFNGVFPWRLHVVSSTAFSETAGNNPTIVWAEEGASTGQYKGDGSKPGYVPIRCVRNLGMPNATASSILKADDNYPSNPLVIVHKPSGTISSSSVYRFDFTNMNEESRRYYTTRELAPGDEYSVMSRLYDGFETGSLINTGNNYPTLKGILESGGTYNNANSGYRVPNVREGVVMFLYCDKNWLSTNTIVSSYYSFGVFGNEYDGNCYTWEIRSTLVTVKYNQNTRSVRLIKDWNP